MQQLESPPSLSSASENSPNVALTFTTVPWCRDGFYTWAYAEEEEIIRREIPLGEAQRAALALFLRHYFAAALLCGMTDPCRRISERLLEIMPGTSLEKCWAQALVGVTYVQDVVKNFAQACYFGEGSPTERREGTLSIAPYEAWALHQTYDYFCQELMPWFVLNDGYPFGDHELILKQLKPLEALRTEWQWLTDPSTGYLRIVYSPSSELFV